MIKESLEEISRIIIKESEKISILINLIILCLNPRPPRQHSFNSSPEGERCFLNLESVVANEN